MSQTRRARLRTRGSAFPASSPAYSRLGRLFARLLGLLEGAAVADAAAADDACCAGVLAFPPESSLDFDLFAGGSSNCPHTSCI